MTKKRKRDKADGGGLRLDWIQYVTECIKKQTENSQKHSNTTPPQNNTIATYTLVGGQVLRTDRHLDGILEEIGRHALNLLRPRG